MKKDAYYFKHDAYARNDPKIKAMMKKYGVEGYGRFWIIIEMLREASGYKLENNKIVIGAIADDLRCSEENASDFIADCIHEYQLFAQEEGFFFSWSLMRRMNELDEVRATRSRAAHTRWDKAEAKW